MGSDGHAARANYNLYLVIGSVRLSEYAGALCVKRNTRDKRDERREEQKRDPECHHARQSAKQEWEVSGIGIPFAAHPRRLGNTERISALETLEAPMKLRTGELAFHASKEPAPMLALVEQSILKCKPDQTHRKSESGGANPECSAEARRVQCDDKRDDRDQEAARDETSRECHPETALSIRR